MKRKPLIIGLATVAAGIIVSVFCIAKFGNTQVLAENNSATYDLTFHASPYALTVQQAFAENNITYYAEDKVDAFPDPSLGLGSVINVKRAPVIKITDGKHMTSYRTWQTTLQGVFDEKKIILGADDKVNIPVSSTINSDSTIKITRVEKTTITEKSTVQFQTVQQNDATIYRGESKTTQEGVNGVKEEKYLVIRKDGDITSQTLTSTNWLTALKNKIIKIGTKLKIDGSKTRSGTASYYGGGTSIASNYLPRGTHVLITNTANGKSFEGVVDDRMANPDRVVDLSKSLWQSIAGSKDNGLIKGTVKVEVVLN